jgi:hypothetical protein
VGEILFFLKHRFGQAFLERKSRTKKDIKVAEREREIDQA